jgi:probable O-glycosylation ligase (exosortase A-associated)
MIDKNHSISQRIESREKPFVREIFSKQLLFAAFALLCVIVGLRLPFLDYKIQVAIILVPLAALIGFYIIRYPFFGVCLFYLYDYSRPEAFFPGMRPLRMGMILELVTLTSWILHLIKTRKRIQWPTFNWMFLAYVGIIASTVITAINNRKAYDVFQSTAVYFILYLIAINVVDSLKRLNKLIWILFSIHVLFAFKGIKGHGIAGGAIMGDENDFALAMNMMIPFAFFMFFNFRQNIKKFGALAVMLVLTVAVVVSLSRGGWVGLMVALTYCIIKSRKIAISLAITAVLVVGIIVFAPPHYWSEVESITNPHEATAADRLHLWRAAFGMFVDYPINGVGANNVGVHMQDYIVTDVDSATQWGRAVHSTYFQILAELGSLGLICYLLMLYTSFKNLRWVQKHHVDDPSDNSVVLANAIMGSILSYLACATFLSTAYYPQITTLFTITMILTLVTRNAVNKTPISNPTPSRIAIV